MEESKNSDFFTYCEKNKLALSVFVLILLVLASSFFSINQDPKIDFGKYSPKLKNLSINQEESKVDILFNSDKYKKLEFSGVEVELLDESNFNFQSNLDIDDHFAKTKDVKNAYAIDFTRVYFENATLEIIAEGKALYVCDNWNFKTQSCDSNWKLDRDLIPGAEYEIDFNHDNSAFIESDRLSYKGGKNLLNSQFVFEDQFTLSEPEIEVDGQNDKIKINYGGPKTKELSFNNVNLGMLKKSNIRYNADLLASNKSEKISWNNSKNPVNAFSIDPTGLEFDYGHVKRVASGTKLYKCADWNYTNQECFGEWKFVQVINPGEEYSIVITPNDPGYIETNETTFDGTFNNTFYNVTTESIQLNNSNDGTYLSSVFDAGNFANWTDIIINRSDVSLVDVSVRSCDDSACVGESFTNLGNISQSSLILTPNRYFQYYLFLDNLGGADPEVFDVNVTSDLLEVDIELIDKYAIAGNNSRINDFTFANVETIEKVVLNYNISSNFANLAGFYFNYTAAGKDACALGNKQDTNCYNLTNPSTTRWIQFVNGTNTQTFDALELNLGDSINFTIQQISSSNWNLTIFIDEHYNPNIFKHYNALFDFSDVKFQTGGSQAITKNNRACISLNGGIPTTAEEYKLDFRVSTSGSLTEPLEAYASGQNCSVSDTGIFLGSKFPSELGAGGKFRLLFGNSLFNNITSLKSIRLRTAENSPSKYYALKTYRATNLSHDIAYYFSTNSGSTYTQLSDGYETELNVNWFNGLPSNTSFVFRLFANDSSGYNGLAQNNITWNIPTDINFAPDAVLITPVPGATITSFPINITFTSTDTNGDALNVSLFWYYNGVLNQTIVTGLNSSVTQYPFNCTNCVNGESYNLTLQVCELNTTELYCDNDTHTLTYDENATLSVSVALLDIVPLDTDGDELPSFDVGFLSTLDAVRLVYEINSSQGFLDEWYFNFTAGGPNACATGNRQVGTCYNITNTGNKWIQFKANQTTGTFNATKVGRDDGIEVNFVELFPGRYRLNLTMNEHYNPNVFKRYDANLDFSKPYFEMDDKDLVITKNNEICYNVTDFIIPVTADYYKIDFQVNHSSDPSNNLPQEPEQPLLTYISNKSCDTFDTGTLVGSRFHLDMLGDEGIKYRAFFTKNAVDQVGQIKSIRLDSEDSNPNKFYTLALFPALVPAYETKWYYSNDAGASFQNLGSSNETGLNVNWFSCNINPTITHFQLYAKATTQSTIEADSITWDLDCDFNIGPNIVITQPISNQSISSFPMDISYFASDTNGDALTTTLQLFQNGTFVDNIIVGSPTTSQTISYTCASCESGTYQIVATTCETSTLEGFCSNATTIFRYIPAIDVTGTFPLKLSITPNHVEPNEIALIELISSIDNITIPEFSIYYVHNNITDLILTDTMNVLVDGVHYYEFNVTNMTFGNYLVFANFSDVFDNLLYDSKVFSIVPRGVLEFSGITPNTYDLNKSVLLGSEIKGNEEIISGVTDPELRIYLDDVLVDFYNLTNGLEFNNSLISLNYTFAQEGSYLLEWTLRYYNRSKITREIVAVMSVENITNQNVADLINENMDKLDRIISKTEEIQDFSQEEIYLITDSVNSMNKVSDSNADQTVSNLKNQLDQLQNKYDNSITGKATSESLFEFSTDLVKLNSNAKIIFFILAILMGVVVVRQKIILPYYKNRKTAKNKIDPRSKDSFASAQVKSLANENKTRKSTSIFKKTVNYFAALKAGQKHKKMAAKHTYNSTNRFSLIMDNMMGINRVKGFSQKQKAYLDNALSDIKSYIAKKNLEASRRKPAKFKTPKLKRSARKEFVKDFKRTVDVYAEKEVKHNESAKVSNVLTNKNTNGKNDLFDFSKDNNNFNKSSLNVNASKGTLENGVVDKSQFQDPQEIGFTHLTSLNKLKDKLISRVSQEKKSSDSGKKIDWSSMDERLND